MIVGVIVQTVAARLRFNGDYGDVPMGKRVAMSAVGGIAAFAFGLWVLDNPRPIHTTPFVYRLWLVQTLAAWGGGITLDAGSRLLRLAGEGMGRKGGNHD